MSAPAVALGYTAAAGQFVGDLASATSTHLKAQTAMDVQDGAAPHMHGFTTFGSGAALKTAILGAVSVTGAGIDPFLSAYTTALIAHLAANAGMTLGSGAGHLHTLS
jgi:hypothetical protein